MKNVVYIILLFNLIFVSCVKDIDFNQIDDIEIYTDHNVSLIYSTLDVSDFLDDFGNETLFLSDTTRIPIFIGPSDTTRIPIFIGPYTENYLIQADFNYKITNTFNRTVIFQYEFLDENNNSIYSFQPIHITPNSIDSEFTQTIVEVDIPSVLITNKIVVKILMDSGVLPLDLSQNYLFNFQSAVILHYKVTVDDE